MWECRPAIRSNPTSTPLVKFILIKFVLGFRGTQFIAGGIIAGLQGAFTLYICTVFEQPLQVYAPGISEGVYLEFSEFLGQALLVWLALSLLPCSAKKGRPEFLGGSTAHQRREFEKDNEAKEAALARCCTCCWFGRCLCRWCDRSGRRGGRFGRLLLWDMFWFMTTSALLCLAVVLEGWQVTSWQTATTFFWAKAVYSLMMFPYFVFTFPGLSKILTHSFPTGFDKYGQCRHFKIPKQVHGSSGSSGSGGGGGIDL